MDDPSRFTFRTARSAPLVAGVILAIAVETNALHLWLAPTSPRAAWTLTVLSLLTAGWLIGDFRAMGRSAIEADATYLHLRVGWRAVATVQRATVTAAIRPSWREVPPTGTAGYLNVTKPADPNVLLTCDPAVAIRLAGGLTRRARLIGLHVDNADALVALLQPAHPA